MLDFFRSFFRKQASSTTAKERLKLVLLSDHISLAPDVVESLKRDLVEVLSRYVEIDEQAADVSFEHRDSEIAMTANIPIIGMRKRPRTEIVIDSVERPAPKIPAVTAVHPTPPTDTQPSVAAAVEETQAAAISVTEADAATEQASQHAEAILDQPATQDEPEVSNETTRDAGNATTTATHAPIAPEAEPVGAAANAAPSKNSTIKNGQFTNANTV